MQKTTSAIVEALEKAMIYYEEALQVKALGLALKVLRYVTKHTQVFDAKFTDHIVKTINESLG